jgi:glycosyltransferase involved in cell wall biosynthesis
MKPRVSIISIFYNGEEYLAEAIESVLAQDCQDFELLLVDDGSTDGSTAIAERYADRDAARIRCLHHPGHANRGMSASRNVGLQHARGDLIAFIDADDRWRPNKLREQLGIFDEHPEIDALCGTVNYWRSWEGGHDELVPTGHVRNRAIPPPEASICLYPLGRAAAPCPSDLMVRRSVALALGGFDESFTGPLQMYEDQAFLAKLYLQHTIYFADACWLDYRRHDRSCMSEVTRDGRYEEVRQHFLDWFERYLLQSPHRDHRGVRAALSRAQLQYRYPRATRPMRLADKILRKLSRA